jgi:hypothetical protein
MYTVINEPISVGAIFSSGKIIPRFFIWNRRKYRVEEVTYFWRSKIGSVPILHFAVVSYESVYEISYNSETSDWHLEKVYVE